MIYLCVSLAVCYLALVIGYFSQAKDLDILWRKIASIENGPKVIQHYHSKVERPKGKGAEALFNTF